MSKATTLETLRRNAARCTDCDLYQHATQTVCGQGSATARIMLTGEQPGDSEDLAGLPFVGPAGQLLDQALQAAGIDRSRCYVTNAVKHFKWQPRGKRRLHKTPAQREIQACRHWLQAEVQALAPAIIVCLGATAAKALLGADTGVTRDHGQVRLSLLGPRGLATMQPSALLRMTDPKQRAQAFDILVADLRVAREL
jgi:uracil-DNA glycosylase